MSKVEQVGAALTKACMEEFGSTWSYDVSLKFARAAIEAMMEPTSEMCHAGIRARAKGEGVQRIDDAWRAMITATLTETPKP